MQMLFGLVNGLNRALVIKLKTAKALGIDVPAAVPTSDPLGADFAAVRSVAIGMEPTYGPPNIYPLLAKTGHGCRLVLRTRDATYPFLPWVVKADMT